MRRSKSAAITRAGIALCVLVGAVGVVGLTPGGKRLVDKIGAVYVIIDLCEGSYTVSPALASARTGAESFESMMKRLKPHAAITGTYFDPDRKPLGDIVIGGKQIVRGVQRQGIGFTRQGKIRFIERRGRSGFDWRGCYSGIACGPRLLRSGRKDINVRRDGFASVAERKLAARSAVGATKDGKLVFCVVLEPVALGTMADAMLELGAEDAINMDGGPLCALYVDGNYRARPLSDMSSILAVYRR